MDELPILSNCHIDVTICINFKPQIQFLSKIPYTLNKKNASITNPKKKTSRQCSCVGESATQITRSIPSRFSFSTSFITLHNLKRFMCCWIFQRPLFKGFCGQRPRIRTVSFIERISKI
ncbi:hypothetical protein HHI36_010041 [Cryptolaemus montrouzieri]|uniref:Uncharacterized protein n=1 Tax=Cryptolaemus montrouzieri TaxID=559131 RepID=A0ABD2MHM9_9CUCU